MRAIAAFLLLFCTYANDARDLPRYRNVAPERGFMRPNSFGSHAKKLITETTGSGAASCAGAGIEAMAAATAAPTSPNDDNFFGRCI